MGEIVAVRCGFPPTIFGDFCYWKTTAADTRRSAHEMLALGVDLILFAGGDGTARYILTQWVLPFSRLEFRQASRHIRRYSG
jgi:predicted polyphosphate/ATP-dependent NAD kinase